jgi:hypothetical protein
MQAVDSDTAVVDLVAERFPEIPEVAAGRLRGSDVRPMPVVRRADPYTRLYTSRTPHFRLEVDDRVKVTRIGDRVIHIELPPDSGPIDEKVK